MKVTIITTCLNRVHTIGRAIESVIRQDYADIEYIVVDGGSTDGTLDVINRYRDHISHLVSEPDHGMYEAINKGLRLATGDVIGRSIQMMCSMTTQSFRKWLRRWQFRLSIWFMVMACLSEATE